jgi:hypothetical protein
MTKPAIKQYPLLICGAWMWRENDVIKEVRVLTKPTGPLAGKARCRRG